MMLLGGLLMGIIGLPASRFIIRESRITSLDHALSIVPVFVVSGMLGGMLLGLAWGAS